MEIWINPACSKCRSALTILDAEGAQYTVRRYLEDVPSEAEIAEVLGRLGLEPWDIVRTQEAAAKELGLKEWPRDETSRARWIARARRPPEADPAPHHHRRGRYGGGGADGGSGTGDAPHTPGAPHTGNHRLRSCSIRRSFTRAALICNSSALSRRWESPSGANG